MGRFSPLSVMPIKHAAFKAWRKTKKNTSRNAQVKSNVSALLRHSRKMVKALDLKPAAEEIKKAIVALDKAAQNKIMKKNTVSRLKSRLMKSYNEAVKTKK